MESNDRQEQRMPRTFAAGAAILTGIVTMELVSAVSENPVTSLGAGLGAGLFVYLESRQPIEQLIQNEVQE